MDTTIFNIIVAAGRGSRFGADCPKQFCMLNGLPVLMHTIARMREALPGSKIILVISQDMHPLWEEQCREAGFTSPSIVYGGDTRWQSVKNAIDSIGEVTSGSIISIHDGARPNIDHALVGRVISATNKSSGAIPAIPVTDSLRRVLPDGSSEPIDRALFRAVQTPQAFRADRLIEAYNQPYNPEFTDDASVMAAAGYSDINLVDGDARNIKITNPADIEIAAILMRQL